MFSGELNVAHNSELIGRRKVADRRASTILFPSNLIDSETSRKLFKSAESYQRSGYKEIHAITKNVRLEYNMWDF